MKIPSLFFAAIVVTLIASAFAEGQPPQSEQRVLLSFDEAGHHVRQIVRTDGALMTLRSDEATSRSIPSEKPGLQSLIAQLEPGTARLIWRDESGQMVSNTEEPDPRISRAPAHIVGEGRVGSKADGAWLVTGPGSGKMLTILLPADPSVALSFEQWDVYLNTQ